MHLNIVASKEISRDTMAQLFLSPVSFVTSNRKRVSSGEAVYLNAHRETTIAIMERLKALNESNARISRCGDVEELWPGEHMVEVILHLVILGEA